MVKEIIFTLPPNGDQNQGPKYLGAGCTLLTIAFASCIVRVLVRGRLTRNIGWDDHWMVITMISNLVGLGFVSKEVADGLGRHMYYLTPGQIKNFVIIGWLDWMQTFITIMFCKISICMFLLRIKNTRANCWFMYTMIACNVIVTTVVVGLFIGICSPPNAYWIVGKDGRCMSNTRLMAVVISQGTITDVILATTPLLFLKDLQISRRTKISLCILMGAGYITAACCIVRTALSGQILEIDQTYAMIPNAAWRATEVNLGIICANAPILRPLYLFYRGRLQRKSKSSSYVATKPTNPSADGSGPKSNVRVWPGRWSNGGKDSRAARKLEEETEATGYTDASAELGLPIEGYLMKNGKRDSHWIELADEETGRMRAQEWTPRSCGKV